MLHFLVSGQSNLVNAGELCKANGIPHNGTVVFSMNLGDNFVYKIEALQIANTGTFHWHVSVKSFLIVRHLTAVSAPCLLGATLLVQK